MILQMKSQEENLSKKEKNAEEKTKETGKNWVKMFAYSF